jgi:phenylacetate-CoA ligase
MTPQHHSFDTEAAYLRLPVRLQNVACSFVGWRTERTRYAGAFSQLLEEYVARSYWSEDQIRDFRDRRISDWVKMCAERVPFYRDQFQSLGVDPLSIRSIEDLGILPILTKTDVQMHADELVSTSVPEGDTRIVHTSGTTGGALRFPVTMSAGQKQWAVWWRYRGWHGIRKGTWSALFAGRSIVPVKQREPPFWRVNRPGRQLLFSGYHMSPENLGAYVSELRRRRPPWLHGYPSLLTLVAGHLLNSGADLGYQVRWITTGAENLMPHQSSAIERAFGVRPIQHYGLAEAVANISQCERGLLHVDEDFAAVEFVPTGRSGVHRIVGTNLTNRAAPLIRYDTQDLVTLEVGAACGCGRPGRIVHEIDGRREDYIFLGDGTRIGRMDHIFKDMVNIQEAQIHQTRPGEITIRVVRGSGYSGHDEHALREETTKRVGPSAKVEIEYVPSLPRSRTGKLRFVVSEVEGASIAEMPLVVHDPGSGPQGTRGPAA